MLDLEYLLYSALDSIKQHLVRFGAYCTVYQIVCLDASSGEVLTEFRVNKLKTSILGES